MRANRFLMIGRRAVGEVGCGHACGDRSGRRQRGMTLVEVMVAMVIGLLVTMVAGTVFIASRQSFRVQDNFAQMQEGGRAVLEDVSVEIRKAGSYGCYRWKDVIPPVAITANLPTSGAGLFPIPMKTLTAAAFDQTYDVRGGPVAGLGPFPVGWGITVAAGTDYVQVMYGQPLANLADDALAGDPTGTAPITLNHGIAATSGQPFLIADCESMTLLRVDSTASGAAGTPLLHQPTANNVNWPSIRHPMGSTLMGFQAIAFFVGTDATGTRNLYRWDRSNSAFPQPLVANVDDMRVVFGVDGGVGELTTVTQWLDGVSVTAWERVITVAVHVVLRSNDSGLVGTGLAADQVSFTWDATKKIFVQGTSASDFAMRRPYVINSVIRSRAPMLS